MAAEEERVHENVRTVVLDDVAPNCFEVFNLCDIHGSG